MPLRKNKLLFGCLAGLLGVFIFGTVAYLKVFEPFQLRIADQLYREKVEQIEKKIAIVEIDDSTLDPVEGLGTMSDWGRERYAQVVRILSKYQPKVIAFDILFKVPRTPDGDEDFKNALTEAKNPLLIFSSNPLSFTAKGYYHNQMENEIAKLILPLGLFADLPNMTLAINNAINDADNYIRRLIPGIFDQDRKIFDETLAFAVVRRFFDAPAFNGTPNISSAYYEIPLNDNKKLQIPLEDGQMIIHYRPDQFYHFSFADVYREKVDLSVLKDKIVLIGVTSQSIKDVALTPLDSLVSLPGVEMLATKSIYNTVR